MSYGFRKKQAQRQLTQARKLGLPEWASDFSTDWLVRCELHWLRSKDKDIDKDTRQHYWARACNESQFLYYLLHDFNYGNNRRLGMYRLDDELTKFFRGLNRVSEQEMESYRTELKLRRETAMMHRAKKVVPQ